MLQKTSAREQSALTAPARFQTRYVRSRFASGRVPIGRRAAESLDHARKHIDDLINVLVCVVSAQAETDRTVNRRERHMHRLQHVRGIERAGRAGRSAGRTNSVGVEFVQQSFAFDVVTGNVERIRQPDRPASVILSWSGSVGCRSTRNVNRKASLVITRDPTMCNTRHAIVNLCAT